MTLFKANKSNFCFTPKAPAAIYFPQKYFINFRRRKSEKTGTLTFETIIGPINVYGLNVCNMGERTTFRIILGQIYLYNCGRVCPCVRPCVT